MSIILRTLVSPYGDTTKGSVLSQGELDNNFIELKGDVIVSAETIDGIVTLKKLNGNNISFEGGGSGGTESYTNSTPTTATLGGIAAGSTFSSKTMTEMWNLLLYPYQTPAFTSFGRTNLTSPYDLGEAITIGSQTFSWVTSNPGNVSANTITIQQLSPSTTTLLSGGDNDGSEVINLTINISSTTPTTLSMYRITATNTNGSTFNSTISGSWSYRWYYGKSSNTSVTNSEITGFTSALITSVVDNYITFGSTGGPEYGYLVIPSSLGQPSDLRNSTSGCFGSNIPYSSLGATTFSNAYGVSTTYTIYRTTNAFVGSLDTWLCS